MQKLWIIRLLHSFEHIPTDTGSSLWHNLHLYFSSFCLHLMWFDKDGCLEHHSMSCCSWIILLFRYDGEKQQQQIRVIFTSAIFGPFGIVMVAASSTCNGRRVCTASHSVKPHLNSSAHIWMDVDVNGDSTGRRRDTIGNNRLYSWRSVFVNVCVSETLNQAHPEWLHTSES